MYRPPPPHMMANMYRGPRPFNNRWRPRAPHPPGGFQNRPTFYRAPVMNITENNEEYWCETCDRGFHTANLLDKHKQQHQKCNIDGCQFIAHPKVITKHIQMQHSSGLYKKIAKLDNPEEINKWREERKKKYPTRTNIEKKEAECKEKIARGEKMALKRGRNGNHKSLTDNKRGHSFDQRDQNHRPNEPNFNQRQNKIYNKSQPPRKFPKIIPKIPDVVEKNKLKPFAGILSIEMDDKDDGDEADVCNTLENSNILIEDDYYEQSKANECSENEPAQEPALCGALTSLVCDYGSSDEEPDEKENKDVVSNDKTQNAVENIVKINSKTDFRNTSCNDTVKNKVIINNDISKNEESIIADILQKDVDQTKETKSNDNNVNSDDDSPEEVKTIKSDIQETTGTQQETKKNIRGPGPPKKNIPLKNNQRPRSKYKHKIPSTLLYKLLHKEIRHERNIVLQCIRYVKKMNYFDKSSQ